MSAEHPQVECLPVFHSFIPPAYDRDAKCADLADIDSLDTLFSQTEPYAVVNLACLPVGVCEKSPDIAKRLQVTGTANLARVCGRHVRLIQVSTDMVYSGNKGVPYTEKDEPDPITVYGRTKLDGELEIRKRAGNYVILRSALVIGRPYFRPNGFLDWMAQSLLNAKPITLFPDQWRTPITAPDLVRIILSLIERDERGVYLAGGMHGVNRVRMGEWLAQALEADLSLIHALPMADFKGEVPLQRDLRLDSSLLNSIAGNPKQDIEAYIREQGRNYRRKNENIHTQTN